MNNGTTGRAGPQPSCPAILDIEASGFGHASYPLEIGIAMPDGSTRCFLIRPEPDWTHWDASSEKLHGLNRAVLLAHGRPVAEIVAELDRLLRGMTVYSDAWGHDLSWLGRLYDCVDRVPAFRLETLPAILTPGQLAIWDRVKHRIFQEVTFPRHRASNDARVLQLTWLRTTALLTH